MSKAEDNRNQAVARAKEILRGTEEERGRMAASYVGAMEKREGVVERMKREVLAARGDGGLTFQWDPYWKVPRLVRGNQ